MGHPVPMGYKYTDLALQDARLATLVCEKTVIAECKEVKPGLNMEESRKESCGSKRDVWLMMMMRLSTERRWQLRSPTA
jgi:hypothetical protein